MVRGGYGAFYDPQANQGTTIRQERQWPFDLIYTISPGTLFPSNTVSQGFLTLGQIPPATFANPFGSLKGINHNFKNASGQQFNLSLQRQLTGHSSFTMGYVGSITHHLSWNDPADQPSPGPGNIQARRPFNAQYPNVTAIAYYESVGVVFTTRCKPASSNSCRADSSLPQCMCGPTRSTMLPTTVAWNGPIPQDPTNRNADYASSDNDIHNRVNVYGTYELPFGPGRAFLNSNSFLGLVCSGRLAGKWHFCGAIGSAGST